MIQDKITSNNNKIKENKYKILRMSLLLGNGEDKEDTINNFEEASKEIDAMNDEIYLKDLQDKFYDTLTLEEEEKKLAILVDYIGGRIEQRQSLLNDFLNVTGFELLNLPPIKYHDKLDEYKERLSYIREYLENSKNINNLKNEVSELENKLNDSYVNKAKAEERNTKSERELLNKFETIIKRKTEFKDINIETAQVKLSDIINQVQDSKKSLDIFKKSFATLNEAGISGEEEKEYLSYVNSAKDAYYNNKEQEFIIRLYISLNIIESEYNKILLKRDNINDIIYERIELRKELNLSNEDILSNIYSTLERQYEDIVKQKDNIENIEYLNSEITRRNDMISELEKDNQKVEILSLLKEFCIIDTYDNDVTESKIELSQPEKPLISKIEKNDSQSPLDNDLFTKENNNIPITEEKPIESSQPQEPTPEKDDIFNQTQSNINIPQEQQNASIKEENPEVQPESSTIPNIEEYDVKDNQVISITDATKIDIDAATQKSNNVMKRVGEMLGVKIEKTETPSSPQPQEPEKKSEPISEPTSQELPKVTPSNDEPIFKPETYNNSVDFKNNMFTNTFDADPETNKVSFPDKPQKEIETTPKEENPLFKNSLANTTIDDVMKNNQNIIDNSSNNDFWSVNEDAPMDLNSLPDIKDTTDFNNNNAFFAPPKEESPSLEFPNLDIDFGNKEDVA